MVGLRRDRKGMVEFVDTMVFLCLLSVAAAGIFSFVTFEQPEEPLAKTISDDLLSSSVRVSDVTDSLDGKVFPIGTVIAASLNSGDTMKVQRYLLRSLDDLIPGVYGYEMKFTYGDRAIVVERHSPRSVTSEYHSEIRIDGAGVLEYSLLIY